MPLVEDGIAFFLLSGEIWKVGILSGEIGIDVVNRMGVNVTGQHREALAKAMTQVDVEGVVMHEAVIHVSQDHRIWGLRRICDCRVTDAAGVSVELYP